MGRVAGMPAPWTNDFILLSHRFTNTYRASDRVSQYLIRNVIYEGDQAAEEIFFRVMLFKMFNRIDTWENLQKKIKILNWKYFSFDKYAKILDALMESDQRLYSAAYIMPSPAFGNKRKHRNHLQLLEYMIRDGAPEKLVRAKTFSDIFKILLSYPSFGGFLAFQFSVDLNYSTAIDFPESQFVVAGPGAKDGISKCFYDTAGLTEEELIYVVTEMAGDEFNRLGLDFITLWGRPLQPIDCQNIFCEISKYARIAHPEYLGESGRTRIKQKFSLNNEPLPQWYPPKWKINDKIKSNCFS